MSFFAGKNKYFFQILSLSVIVLGLAAGVILTQQKQLFNQKAASTAVSCGSLGFSCGGSPVSGATQVYAGTKDDGIKKFCYCCSSSQTYTKDGCVKSCPAGQFYCAGCINACVNNSNLPSSGCTGYIAAHCNQSSGNDECSPACIATSDTSVCCNGVCQESCGSGPVPNCKNLTISGGSTTLVNGNTYTLSAGYDTTGRKGYYLMQVASDGAVNCTNGKANTVFGASHATGTKGDSSFSWTVNAAPGTYLVYCSSSASGYGSCSGEIYKACRQSRQPKCKGPTSSVLVTVVNP